MSEFVPRECLIHHDECPFHISGWCYAITECRHQGKEWEIGEEEGGDRA